MRHVFCERDPNEDVAVYHVGIVGLDGNAHTIKLRGMDELLALLSDMVLTIQDEVDRILEEITK